MEFTTELFKAYKGLVHASAIELSNKYGVDQEHLSGEGMILFVHAVDTFDSEKKVAFSTHLYWTLKNLEKIAQKEKKRVNQHIQIEFCLGERMVGDDSDLYTEYNQGFFEQAISTIDFSQEKYDLLHDIAKQLSEEAQVYIMDLFKGVHTQKRNVKGGRPEKFPIEKIASHYNWSFQQTKNVKHEIKVWWKDYCIAG